jgi:hypothetical protein
LKSRRRSRQNATALAISTGFHLAVLALILSQAAPAYQTPDSVAPPLDVQITTLPEPPPPLRIIVPHIRPPEVAEKLATKPAPATPPPKPVPPKPAPPPPPTAAPQPNPAPAAKPFPLPPAPPVPPVPATPKPAAAAAPAAATTPMRLNIHKPDKDAPATVPTLPFAPAPSPRVAGGTAGAVSGGEPALGGSRLTGLTPYAAGAMPSGGSGLRGTLVGCANAEAVSLSAAERVRCNERFGASASSAPALDSISPAKRAAFGKAAAAQEADRRYRSGMPTGTTSGKSGFGSGLGDDQPTAVRDQLFPHP